MTFVPDDEPKPETPEQTYQNDARMAEDLSMDDERTKPINTIQNSKNLRNNRSNAT